MLGFARARTFDVRSVSRVSVDTVARSLTLDGEERQVARWTRLPLETLFILATSIAVAQHATFYVDRAAVRLVGGPSTDAGPFRAPAPLTLGLAAYRTDSELPMPIAPGGMRIDRWRDGFVIDVAPLERGSLDELAPTLPFGLVAIAALPLHAYYLTALMLATIFEASLPSLKRLHRRQSVRRQTLTVTPRELRIEEPDKAPVLVPREDILDLRMVCDLEMGRDAHALLVGGRHLVGRGYDRETIAWLHEVLHATLSQSAPL